MKNIINYYYNLNLLNLYEIGNKYCFTIDNNDYVFMIYNRPIDDAPLLYNLNIGLKERRIMVNDIITNKDNQIITLVNNIPYVLIRNTLRTKSITMNDLLYIQNNTININGDKKLYRTDWIKMWSDKIDYYENEISHSARKYKLLSEVIDFYIGLGENAIEYLVDNNFEINDICLSHKRIDINKGSFDFYNPVNFIFDSRVRDFAEYIKNLFFYEKINFEILQNYLNYINFTRNEYILFVSRMLFPTNFFDQVDLILEGKCDEISLKKIVDKTSQYIAFVKNIFIYIIYNKRINIPIIEWILKKTD